MPDATIITGSLSDKELRNSIKDLVDYVGRQTNSMANSFVVAMNTMKGAMKDFAVTQKVSVTMMQQAWRQMSVSFDAMMKMQQEGAASSGGGGGGSAAGADTVKSLQELIAQEEARRREMVLETSELAAQNEHIAKLKQYLKEELSTHEEIVKAEERKTAEMERRANRVLKSEQASYKEQLAQAVKMPANQFEQATQKLKELQRVKDEMQKSGLFKPSELMAVEQRIDNLKVKIQRLSDAKPKSLKDVLGMDESSVEALAKKMAALKRVKVDPSNKDEVNQLSNAYKRLSVRMGELMGRTQGLEKTNNTLARSFSYIRNRLVYALTLGAASQFIKQIYEIRSQYELLERSLGVLVGSFQRGSEIFQQLNAMALKSPFTLIELGTAAKQLTAYDFAAKDVVDTTRRLADISAALGVPMERLTYNLGQIRAQTVLTARDARDFANAGLPIVKSLADYYSNLEGRIVSTGDVYDRLSKKMVSYNDVMAVLLKMTDEGGKFFDFQAKQANTLRVQLANLSLAWNNTLNQIGESNQSLLSAPVKGLRVLLQNWKTLDRAIWDVIYLLGAFKTLSVIYTLHANRIGEVNRNLKVMYVSGQKTIAMFKSLGATLKTVFLNPTTWVLALFTALVDLSQAWQQNRDNLHDFNEELRRTSGESEKGIDKFLINRANVSYRGRASKGQLSEEESRKAWEAISDEIENSAASSKTLLSYLNQIEDANRRVSEAFTILEKIRQADNALQNLREDSIKYSQSLLGGIFGEGLVDDLKDYVDAMQRLGNPLSRPPLEVLTGTTTLEALQPFREEFLKELEVVAQSINNFIVAYNIKDPLQIEEILEQVKAQIKAKNPEIQGELAKVFDIELSRRMSEVTNGAVDESMPVWNTFMEMLKTNSSAAFQSINKDIYDKSKDLTTVLSKEALEAIDKNLERFRLTMPFYYEAVKNMVEDVNKLRIHIGTTFGVTKEDEKKIIDQLTSADTKLAEAEQRRNRLQAYLNKLTKEGKDNTEDYRKAQKELSAAIIDVNKAFAEGGERKKTGGGGGQKKDLFGDALTKEIQVLNELQRTYKEYRRQGLSTQEALAAAAEEYGETIKRNNAVLEKYGMKTLSTEKLATMPLQKIREFYVEQLQLAKSLGVSAKGVEAIEKAIAGLNLEISKESYTRMVDGLNNQLSKLKDDYELAVELDAQPELGEAFAQMFGIDTSTLPKTITQYIERVQAEFDRVRGEKHYEPTLDVFKATDADWKQWASDVGMSEEALKSFNARFVEARQYVMDWRKDVISQARDLQYKLVDTNDKIAIEQEKLANLQIALDNEVDEHRRMLLRLQIQEQQNAIDQLKAGLLSELPAYQKLFNSIADYSGGVTNRLAKEYLAILNKAVSDGADAKGKYHVRQGDVDVPLTRKELDAQIRKTTTEARKSASVFEKIKLAFKGGDNEEKDFAKGLELVAGEAEKAADGLRLVADIVSALGGESAEEATEVINDIAETMGGLATAAQGYAQLQSGDIIGGAVNIAKGLWQSISSWFDNSNKRIDRSIKESERTVTDLERAYAQLEFEAQRALGSEEMAAQKALIANKKLQLAEIERQLQLEKSREEKNKDIDKIKELESAADEARRNIIEAQEDVVNNLMGEDIKAAAESFVDAWVAAWKEGEDTLEAVNGKFDDMMENFIKKSVTAAIVKKHLEAVYQAMDLYGSDNEYSDAELKALAASTKYAAERIDEDLTAYYGHLEDIDYMSRNLKDSNLSALQAGIQGVTEETAGALEAYMNGVSQQVYLHSELLSQIRDVVVGWEHDVQLSTLSQMLLQLQQSYQTQQAIQGILEGWNNPSGQAVRVEII